MAQQKNLQVQFNNEKCYINVKFSEILSYEDLENSVRNQLSLNGGVLKILDSEGVRILPAAFSEVETSYYIIRHEEDVSDAIGDVPVRNGYPEATGNIVENPNMMPTLIAKELRKFFRVQRTVLINGAELLTKNKLTERERKMAIRIIANHLLLYRPQPKKDDKIAYAKATVELFPSLKIDSPRGYDAVYNPDKRSGFLGNCINRMLSRKREECNVFEPTALINQGNSSPVQNNIDYCIDLEEVKDELKTLFWRNDEKKIFDAMEKTFPIRRKFLKTPLKKNILLEYPRFLDTRGLIQLDFQLLFPDKNNCLKELFDEEFQTKLCTLGNTQAMRKIDNGWPTPIWATLNWLSLLPPTGGGRGHQGRPSLKEACGNLIQFYEAGRVPDAKPSPTIIAQGNTRSDIRKFYVSLDESLIVTNDTFLDALDIMFKMHFVFDLEYEASLRNFFRYIQNYVFKIKGNETPNTTINKCRMILMSNE
ncbi:uncharacterized protein LOC129807292 [Phlebotomus papatasi]|uniref:uncharacterized protein LOC129807292 n=1 Tax=Phlebotomus papatasi TaxID=29031 RepID=UPI002483350B|nr:uncharacterized protein LOC129807292 [Phlebotomus papatasi]